VASLDSNIDALYKGPLGDFIRERGALAKTLKGADAGRVKGLQKPLLVPWVVNQVYWHARPVYQQLVQAGETLRDAQVAALSGRSADVRNATSAHRDALAAAVREGIRLATTVGAQPNLDQLARTFEALSLARKHPEVPGRLTKPLVPAGFEALGGVAVKTPASPLPRTAAPAARPATSQSRVAEQAAQRQAEVARRKDAARRKAHAAALKKAEAELTRARSLEARAREKWEQAKRHLDVSDRALKSLRET
jgi:hypothetical protein